MAQAVPPIPDSLGDAFSKQGAKDGGGGAGMANVAVVDMTRLYNASGAALAYDRKVGEVTGDAQQRIKTITGVSQLAPADLQEFITLIGKAAPTEAEQKRMKELQTLADSRSAEYVALQSKTDLTAADSQALRNFGEQEKMFRNQLLPNITDGFRQGVSARMDVFRAEQMEQIRAVVAQIAKQKHITHVFDSAVLIYCENDLTAAVLLKLKKR